MSKPFIEYIAGSLDNINYVRVVMKHNGKFVLPFHRQSQKWDWVGGGVKKDETALEAMKRELFEETGAVDYDIFPIFDHESFNENGTHFNNARTYYAIVREFANLPDESEMDKIGFFDKIPVDFRYGDNSEQNSEQKTEFFKRIEKLASAHFK